MGSSSQELSIGGTKAEVSGLVSGVSIGVVRGVVIGVVAWLLAGEVESILSAKSCDKLNRSAANGGDKSSCSLASSHLPFSIPR